MSKLTLLVIAISLLMPLILAKTNSKNQTSPKHNSEDDLDFWDFDTDDSLFEKKIKRSANSFLEKSERQQPSELKNTFDELAKILKSIEKNIEQLEKGKKINIDSERILEERVDFNEDDNGEGNVEGETGNINEALNDIFRQAGTETVTLTGSIEYEIPFDDFDQETGKANFIAAISKVSGVKPEYVKITNIRRGSVIFDFEIVAPISSTYNEESVKNAIASIDRSIRDSTLDGRLQVFSGTIKDYTRTIATPQVDENNGKGSGSPLMFILVVGVLILSGISFMVYRYKKKAEPQLISNKYTKKKANPSTNDDLDYDTEGKNDRSQNQNPDDSIKFYAGPSSLSSPEKEKKF